MPQLVYYRDLLRDYIAQGGTDFSFTVEEMPGGIEVLHIAVQEEDALPIYLSVADRQILCVAHLFRSQDVAQGMEAPLHTKMLEMNIPMPLSSFGKIGDLYVVFGAVAPDVSLEGLVLELRMLHHNALQAWHSLEQYLRPM
jgi:uncharacterized protein YjfI (DUF2170 family)